MARPIAVLHVGRMCLEQLLEHSFYVGKRDGAYGMDRRLAAVFADRWLDTSWYIPEVPPWPYEPKRDALKQFLNELAQETPEHAVSAVWIPRSWWQRGGMHDLLPAVIADVWPGPVLVIKEWEDI